MILHQKKAPLITSVRMPAQVFMLDFKVLIVRLDESVFKFIQTSMKPKKTPRLKFKDLPSLLRIIYDPAYGYCLICTQEAFATCTSVPDFSNRPVTELRLKTTTLPLV
jgi:hypothetical protein